MNFTSPEFLCFFPLVLLLYWLLPHRFRWVLLLIASYLFYLSWNPWMGLLLLGTTLVTYWSARALAGQPAPVLRRLWLGLGAGVPLLLLGVFKYAGFFAETGAALLRLLGIPARAPELDLLLPVGISFYTFQALSYVLDVAKGRIQPELSPGRYALYLSFFPQLVAGPIERPEHLLPQLRAEHRLCWADWAAGRWYLLRGFFKKLVLADFLAGFADPVFARPEAAAGPAVLLGTVCFALQIYCDFSGYSDIALGAARMMGIRLMENFRTPYLAESIQDFWRRWHISLTSWFTDYLYIPLGGSRTGLLRHCRNLLLVFLVSGLWHGANWTFLLWGALHGCYQIAALLLRRQPVHPLAGLPGRLGHLCRRGWVFLLVCLAWVLFRADSVGDAVLLFSHLGTGWDALSDSLALTGMTASSLLQILLRLTCLALLARLPQPLPADASPHQLAQRALSVLLLVTVIAAAWLALLAVHGENVFLYFQF